LFPKKLAALAAVAVSLAFSSHAPAAHAATPQSAKGQSQLIIHGPVSLRSSWS
jgi:hypothetical protein